MGSDWTERALATLVDVKHGFAFSGEGIRESPPGDILVTPGNVAIGGGFKGDKFKYFDGEVPEDYVLSEGDLVVTMTDLSKQADTLGFPAIIPPSSGPRFLHNQRIGKVLVKPDADVDPRFLYYVLCTEEYRHEVLASATGSTVKHTSPGRILAYKAKVPRIEVQRAIAHILGTLDDKIELNRRLNRTLEAMARALFRSWFVDFDPVRARREGRPPAGMDAATAALFPAEFEGSELGEIPKGWRVRSLADMAELLSGGTPKKSVPAFWGGDLPWISPKTMTGIYVDDSEERVTDAAVGNGTRSVPKGTVFVMVRGMGLHQGVRISQARRSLTFNQDVKAIVPKGIDESYMLYAMLSVGPLLFSKVQASGHGTGVLPTDHLLKLRFVVPPADTCNALSRHLASLNDRIAANSRESRTLAALRDALLPKLLGGELGVAGVPAVPGKVV